MAIDVLQAFSFAAYAFGAGLAPMNHLDLALELAARLPNAFAKETALQSTASNCSVRLSAASFLQHLARDDCDSAPAFRVEHEFFLMSFTRSGVPLALSPRKRKLVQRARVRRCVTEPTEKSIDEPPEDADLRRVYDAGYRVARRNGLAQSDAEDVAQAATAVVWANWKTVDSPLAYVATVAERAAWAVRGARRGSALADSDRDTLRDIASDVVGGIYVHDLLASLPAQQARTIDLHYLQGLPIGEVAERLGVTINTVKTHNRLALQRLRSLRNNE